MKVFLAFSLLVVLVLLFHIPAWMMLVHQHNPRNEVLSSSDTDQAAAVEYFGEADVAAEVPKFFVGADNAHQLVTNGEKAFVQMLENVERTADDAECLATELESSLPFELVELKPGDGYQYANTGPRCINCTVVILFCLECTCQSGLPWHIFSQSFEWFRNFSSVEVVVVTRLHRLFGWTPEESFDAADRLFRLGIEPETLRLRSTQTSLRFRVLSLQQGGRPSALIDTQRYSWDLIPKIKHLLVEQQNTPQRALFIAPGFLPVDSSFSERVTTLLRRNESLIVSCVASQAAPSLGGVSTVLSDGFEVYSGAEEKLMVYPRLSGLAANSPRLFASRNMTMFIASPLCFSASWKSLELYWPRDSTTPRPLAGASLAAELRGFFYFSLAAAIEQIDVVGSSATVEAASEQHCSTEWSWLEQLGELARPAGCGSDYLSSSDESVLCEEAVSARWSRRSYSAYRQQRKMTYLEWDTFCVPCFGFTNEVMHFVKPLEDRVTLHVPMNSDCFCPGTPAYFADSLSRITCEKSAENHTSYVFVSHKDPGSFAIRTPRPDVVIGRSMYEFNVLPGHWLKHAQDVDELWVPSRFVRWVFEKNGFPKKSLHILPEPIDVFFFDPISTRPLNLPFPHGLSPWRRATNIQVFSTSSSNESLRDRNPKQRVVERTAAAGSFKFLSVFKWESRKGPDILLQAYFESFTSEDPVSLYLVSYIYGDASRNPERIMEEVRKIFEKVHSSNDSKGNSKEWTRDAPHIEVIGDQLPEGILASLYRSVDCFLFPTRGEGWGLPAIQAMSMGLATIVTNFSGNVDFLTEENAYLIPIEGVEIIPRGSPYGDSPKKAWAVPSVRRLSQLMLHAWRNPEQTKTVGKRARRDIISQYSEEAVAELVLARVDQLVEIKNNAKSSREKLDNLLGNNDAHLLL